MKERPAHIHIFEKRIRNTSVIREKNLKKWEKIMRPSPLKMFHYIIFELQSPNIPEYEITRLYLKIKVI